MKDLRASSSSSLFVSYASPHKPVGSRTLARWMTTILGAAGVDVTIFQQHSSRSASANLLKKRGLTHRQICNLADWSLCSNTFKKFYDRYLWALIFNSLHLNKCVIFGWIWSYFCLFTDQFAHFIRSRGILVRNWRGFGLVAFPPTATCRCRTL